MRALVVCQRARRVQFNSLATVDQVLQHSAEQAGRSSKAPLVPLSGPGSKAPAAAAAGGQDGATLSNATRDFFKYSSFQVCPSAGKQPLLPGEAGA